MLEHSPKIIAVAGKGGVGKTSISAAFVRLLTEAYPDKRILAIDALNSPRRSWHMGMMLPT